MKSLFYYIFFLTQVLCLKSQDFKQDLLAVVNQQNKLEKQCYTITYTLRENHNYNAKILYTSHGKYIKTKNGYLSALDHVLSVNMSDVIIMVNSEHKKIYIQKNTKKTVATPNALKQIEEYNKFIEKIVTTEYAKNKIIYTVELKKTPYPISKYEIAIDTKTKSLIRISLFYKGTLPKDDAYHITGKEVPRMDIEFFDYNNFTKLNEAECTKNFYYIQSNNKLIPTNNFKGYELKQL